VVVLERNHEEEEQKQEDGAWPKCGRLLVGHCYPLARVVVVVMPSECVGHDSSRHKFDRWHPILAWHESHAWMSIPDDEDV
jgi:hypothetical protein